ncbi:MAG: hypothetical protein ACE5I7_18770 [Candidatus Binatia bacterium]
MGSSDHAPPLRRLRLAARAAIEASFVWRWLFPGGDLEPQWSKPAHPATNIAAQRFPREGERIQEIEQSGDRGHIWTLDFRPLITFPALPLPAARAAAQAAALLTA